MTLKQKCVAGMLWSCSVAGVCLLVWSGLENAVMMIASAACLGVGFGGLAAYDAWGCARERRYHHALGVISGKEAAAQAIECQRKPKVRIERTITERPAIWSERKRG